MPPGDDEIPESELEIGGVIGNGAMGVVYRAKWRETDVAVKRLKRSGAANREQLLADFRREVALLKQLSPPAEEVTQEGEALLAVRPRGTEPQR